MMLLRGTLIFTLAAAAGAFYDYSPEQLKLLQDPGGWDYIKMTSGGIQTEHPCFDGHPHPDECSGRLFLKTDHTFQQEVTIHGQTVPRHGTYTLENDQLTFVDELEQPDGPYAVALNSPEKSLVLSTANVRIELILHKTLHDRRRRQTK